MTKKDKSPSCDLKKEEKKKKLLPSINEISLSVVALDFFKTVFNTLQKLFAFLSERAELFKLLHQHGSKMGHKEIHIMKNRFFFLVRLYNIKMFE
jgi:hypothetical protein